jgi:hypothetical protein
VEPFGAPQILRRVHVEEPVDGGQSAGVGKVAGLKQQFQRDEAQGLAQAGRGGLKGGKAAFPAGFQFTPQHRQRLLANHHRKCLGKSIDRSQGDGPAGNPRMMQQINQQ